MEDSFDLDQLAQKFEASLILPNDVALKQYLSGYEELNLFFNGFGTLFGFVASDVVRKLSILEKYLQEDEASYKTVISMIEHEEATKICPDKKDNGCRTLLRLHRALEFSISFLEGLSCADMEKDRMSDMASASYNATLSKYHPWIAQKGVQLAVYMLPSLQDALKLFGGGRTEQEAKACLKTAIGVLKLVYNNTQVVFEQHNMLELA